MLALPVHPARARRVQSSAPSVGRTVLRVHPGVIAAVAAVFAIGGIVLTLRVLQWLYLQSGNWLQSLAYCAAVELALTICALGYLLHWWRQQRVTTYLRTEMQLCSPP